MLKKEKFVLWFKEVDRDDLALVGGKGANLGEMTKFGIPVPNGFIVTAQSYYYFLEKTGIKNTIKSYLQTVDVNNATQLNQASRLCQNEIEKAAMPIEVAQEIVNNYLKLSGLFKECLVAVRSSATAEDLPNASFAGQQATFLNIKGEASLLSAVKSCWASLFTPRAIFYRTENKFDHFKVGIAVPVQKMIQAEVSGVMFTIDPVGNLKNKIIIEAIYGLGELIVQGSQTPDHYEVDKNTLTIEKKEVNVQKIKLIKKAAETKEFPLTQKEGSRQKISDKFIIELARWGKKIENHYFYSQDIEWAIEKGKIYIVQTRPVTTVAKSEEALTQQFEASKSKLVPILTGDPASPGIGVGKVQIINNPSKIDKVEKGEILVTSMTSPDYVPAMKRSSAIVTDLGGRTCHAAIVSRELGIPCIVGTQKATKILKNGDVISVNGTDGVIYKGAIPISKKSIEEKPNKNSLSDEVLKTATKVYVNLAEPELSENISKRNVDGVGLLRAEFMIAQIGTHPKKLIRSGRKQVFIDKMAEGLMTFCKSFYPRPVVYRATDFKTNEYRNLLGGKDYEPMEPNPMLGYRGCFRYIHDPEVFKLELEAIKIVRNKLGLKNLNLMIPFVRTPKELLEVKKILASEDLSRTASFKLWLMVEIPSNVILLEKFIEIGIDGVSIGSNDLTMLLLGTDRDNNEVASQFDERNEAVLWALEKTIKTCNKSNITSSICGQAPSVYPDLTEKLVEWGITSISVSPDMIEKTREIIYKAEEKLISKK